MDLKKFVALSVLDIKNRILPRLPHPISFSHFWKRMCANSTAKLWSISVGWFWLSKYVMVAQSWMVSLVPNWCQTALIQTDMYSSHLAPLQSLHIFLKLLVQVLVDPAGWWGLIPRQREKYSPSTSRSPRSESLQKDILHATLPHSCIATRSCVGLGC